MNNLIREINECEVTFSRYINYYKINWWLESNNIKHDQLDIVVDPATYQLFPRTIRFHNEEDLLLFLLRWGK